MMSLSLTLAEIYAEHSENDGFLYVTYASQEVFGSDIDYSSFLSRNVSQESELVIWLNNLFHKLTNFLDLKHLGVIIKDCH